MKGEERVEIFIESVWVVRQPKRHLAGLADFAWEATHLLAKVGGARPQIVIPRLVLEAQQRTLVCIQGAPVYETSQAMVSGHELGEEDETAHRDG